MNPSSTWSLLVLTLPTENATARMRFYRALKAKGCAVLRDGIYLLPYSETHEEMLRELADGIAESGGTPSTALYAASMAVSRLSLLWLWGHARRNGLVQVVGRGVISVPQPEFERLLLG